MRLALDAGHGNQNRNRGYDPGAVSNGIEEADVALSWSLTGRWVLTREFGIDVYLTRDDDSDPTPVGTRDDKAEAADCSHFLSIHANAANGDASGCETYYRDGVDKAFAQVVQNCLLSAMGLKDRGLKPEAQSQHGKLAVFGFDGAAALMEVGFIDNFLDRARMLERDRRIAFWRALGTALAPKPL